ncbi:MAG: 4Fe-4S binding protein [Candidatus Undinarchaeales archaeon]|jgi:2-oxoacid:acceptor oxidoreductase delta subunit (pyruvate/2-ketoisovalerate family)|nr:4Fe-4S binding protein [Candidatus Undinarchaeales archaeon]MDP7494182.1 4Fe-4S binding protein [Candidatus Undinarchaeales archaeon]
MVELTLAATITEPGSTIKYKTGAWRAIRPIIDIEKCTGCGNCWVYCPEGSVDIKDKKATIDLDYCKGCGICANECPVTCIKMIMEEK